ncbi:MAG: hypothetical protein ACRDPM_04845 [Solirubrobacteraceae bacterium]
MTVRAVCPRWSWWGVSSIAQELGEDHGLLVLAVGVEDGRVPAVGTAAQLVDELGLGGESAR